MTGIEFSRNRAIRPPWTSADEDRRAERGERCRRAASRRPVSTATIPPRRYIEETERSNSPAMIVIPSASATRPYEAKFWKMS